MVKRLGLGISWESLEKMLVNCRRNVGKILLKCWVDVWCWENVGKLFAKCCQNVRKSWQNIGILIVKCWVTVTVSNLLAKWQRCYHISCLFILYVSKNQFDINSTQMKLFYLFWLSFRHSIFYICITSYTDIQFHFNLIATHATLCSYIFYTY